MRVLERLARETGREYALRVLKENIVGLDLLPGSMLSENEIASCLNLSRTPVREAFIELSKVKIVEIYPQKGSVVSLIDYNMVEEARFMRYAGKRCCRTGMSEDHAGLDPQAGGKCDFTAVSSG